MLLFTTSTICIIKHAKWSYWNHATYYKIKRLASKLSIKFYTAKHSSTPCNLLNEGCKKFKGQIWADNFGAGTPKSDDWKLSNMNVNSWNCKHFNALTFR